MVSKTKKQNRKNEAENQNQGNKTEVLTKSKKNQKNKFDEDLDVDEKVDALMGSVFENFVLNQPPLKVDIDNVKDISVKGFSITTSNGNELFKDANLTLSYGHKYGLIGPNGRGKTTLLRHIGVKQFNVPDSLDIFYAEQEVVADQTPAVQAVMKADKERTELEKKVEFFEEKVSCGDLDYLDDLEKAQEALRMLGVDAAESKARQILHGLGFDEKMMEKATEDFSGGWRMRISLARALFMEPSVLLLDEPTNHLDLNAVIWLDKYLTDWKKTLLIVSHDQSFLNNVCSDIIHLNNKKLDYYRGNYEKFLKAYSIKQTEQQKKYEKQKKQIQQEKSKGTSTKDSQKAVIQKQNRLAKGAQAKSEQPIELLEKPKEYSVKFHFYDPTPIKPPIMSMINVDFAYEGCEHLFKGINFALDLDSRITLVGPNGVGKSTFLKLITQNIEPTSGEVIVHNQLVIGKYDQHSSDQLDLSKDPTSYLCGKYNMQQQDVRKLLGQFGLESKAHLVVMKNLSGGQKSRVAFVDASLKRPHLLVLDEPTNNLDIESIGALADAIKIYKGGVIIVTHDERLIRETECQLYEVNHKNVIALEMDFDDYRENIIEKYFDAEEEKEQKKIKKQMAKIKIKNNVNQTKNKKQNVPIQPVEELSSDLSD